jgi:hypothetical protein
MNKIGANISIPTISQNSTPGPTITPAPGGESSRVDNRSVGSKLGQ